MGFLDDDPTKRNRSYRGLKVLGNTHQICEFAQATEAEEVVIALHDLKPARLREILADCEECKIPVRIMPPLSELIGGRPIFERCAKCAWKICCRVPKLSWIEASIAAYLVGQHCFGHRRRRFHWQ